MSKNQIFFLLGSLMLSVSGFTHNLFVDLLRSTSVSFSNVNFPNSMDQVVITIFGGDLTVLSAFNGYSLSFGILTGFLGLFNLIILRAEPEFVFKHREIIIVNIILVIIQLIISILFLFYIPILAMFTVLILFTLSLLVKEKKPSL